MLGESNKKSFYREFEIKDTVRRFSIKKLVQKIVFGQNFHAKFGFLLFSVTEKRCATLENPLLGC